MLTVSRTKAQAKVKRRALSVKDLTKLLIAAKERPLAQMETVHRGARKGERVAQVKPDYREKLIRHGQERQLIYLTAFLTGLRRKELQSLRVKHLVLDGQSPHIFLPGEFTKNGEDAVISLTPQHVELLKGWVAGKQPNDRLFRVPRFELVKALKKDLAFAGIPYKDELNRPFDFHSLRKSLGTYLRSAKVDPAVSKQFMRHSDIRLTMEVYNDARQHDLQAEVTSKLPAFKL